MSTILRTPTRTVTLTLVDPKTDLDWSGDYVGNNRPATLRPDPDGAADYLCDDAEADWWVRQCKRQQEADDALSRLSPEQQARSIGSVGSLDLEDQPMLIRITPIY